MRLAAADGTTFAEDGYIDLSARGGACTVYAEAGELHGQDIGAIRRTLAPAVELPL
jgi:hypothetical protein